MSTIIFRNMKGISVNREYEDEGKFIFTEGQLHKVVFDIE